MKKYFLIFGAILAVAGIMQAKKVLDHDAFDSWKRVRNYAISNNGEWSAFGVIPQEGDATLTFYNTRTNKKVTLERGYEPAFTADGKWGIALIKPLFQATRKAKIDKKKDFDMPQDSLAIIDLRTGKIEKIANVIGYKTGKDGGDWVAYLSCDTTRIAQKALNDKKAGRPLVIRQLGSQKEKVVNWVNSYSVSRTGDKIAVTLKKQKSDSLSTDGCGVIFLPDTSFQLIDRDKKFYGTPVFNYTGTTLAFTASNDSTDSGTRKSCVYTADLNQQQTSARELLSRITERKAPNLMPANTSDKEWGDSLRRAEVRKAEGKEFFVNQYSEPKFSRDGKRLIIGVAPYIAPDDTTLVDFELPTLDIWRWDSPYTPPQEKKMLSKMQKQTLPVVIDLENYHRQLLTTNALTDVQPGYRWDANWALLRTPADIVSHQWDYAAPIDLQIINVNNGEKRDVATVTRDDGDFSSQARYIIWFSDRNYYCYDVATGKTAEISSKIPYPLWDESDDHPMSKPAYGLAAWTEGDEYVLVYDKYDIWRLDPRAEKEPLCLTKGYGRKNNLRFRLKITDPEFVNLHKGDNMWLQVFNYENKYHGLADMKYGEPQNPNVSLLKPITFTQLMKAKAADVFSWQMSDFSTSPDLYECRGTNFSKFVKMSDSNPQMKEYNWGTAQLVKWYAYNGRPTEGVLYVPEDFDPSKKYPMLAVFYEKNSEDLYSHYMMEPSWSWVNYPFYVSRGYVVFVPDIHYDLPGIPGEAAWNYVCSGVEELCKRYNWIDSTRIGIDGQSWGGYQTAYLVTRTNMFACAGSGAPVANMTSAFGGIRWGSGDSRQAQYEQGQSRIGRNLWDATELYVANSPVFHADRVNTPLLIMHNDNDGAVPWYQGIEMFMALRRLKKPVWMLQYNGEEHNLMERRNRKDITIRLQQFFDHYLKGDPMPDWMRQGISPLRKGQEFGTGFTLTE